MKERPIIFSGPMVRAILEGRKTMTRRVVKPQPTDYGLEWIEIHEGFAAWQDGGLLLNEASEAGGSCQRLCPYGQPGDRLWVRETWVPSPFQDEDRGATLHRGVFYKADELSKVLGRIHWRSSIHMPRWASRLTLEIKAVRVERLQDIYYSRDDAIAEGVECLGEFENVAMAGIPASRHKLWKWYGKHKFPEQMLDSPLESFITLWNSVNVKRGYSWDANPYVWVIEFARVMAET